MMEKLFILKHEVDLKWVLNGNKFAQTTGVQGNQVLRGRLEVVRPIDPEIPGPRRSSLNTYYGIRIDNGAGRDYHCCGKVATIGMDSVD